MNFSILTLQVEISFIDFAHFRSLFSGHNDRVLKPESTIQQKKFNNLLKDKKLQHDPEKIISLYSRYALSKAEKSLLLKGLNFNIPPKKLNHADYPVDFEFFYRDIHCLQALSAEDIDFIKTKIKDIALSPFRIITTTLRWCRGRDLFGSQIPVTTEGFAEGTTESLAYESVI